MILQLIFCLLGLQSKFSTGRVWIGAHDIGHEGEYYWVETEEQITGYTYYGALNNANKNEHCLMKQGKWHDRPCYFQMKCACVIR